MHNKDNAAVTFNGMRCCIFIPTLYLFLSKLLYIYLTETVSVGFLVKCRKSLLESLSLRYTLDLSRYSQ